jgi:hypothetical protein
MRVDCANGDEELLSDLRLLRQLLAAIRGTKK